MSKLYKPIPNDKEGEFMLAPRTLNSYKRFLKIMIKSANISKVDKDAYCKSMRWPDSEQTEEYSVEEHYFEMSKLTFIGFENYIKGKTEIDLNMHEIEKATADFLHS